MSGVLIRLNHKFPHKEDDNMKKIFALLLALVMMSACAVAETVNQKDEAVLNIFTWEVTSITPRSSSPSKRRPASRSIMRPSAATRKCMKSSPL